MKTISSSLIPLVISCGLTIIQFHNFLSGGETRLVIGKNKGGGGQPMKAVMAGGDEGKSNDAGTKA